MTIRSHEVDGHARSSCGADAPQTAAPAGGAGAGRDQLLLTPRAPAAGSRSFKIPSPAATATRYPRISSPSRRRWRRAAAQDPESSRTQGVLHFSPHPTDRRDAGFGLGPWSAAPDVAPLSRGRRGDHRRRTTPRRSAGRRAPALTRRPYKPTSSPADLQRRAELLARALRRSALAAPLPVASRRRATASGETCAGGRARQSPGGMIAEHRRGPEDPTRRAAASYAQSRPSIRTSSGSSPSTSAARRSSSARGEAGRRPGIDAGSRVVPQRRHERLPGAPGRAAAARRQQDGDRHMILVSDGISGTTTTPRWAPDSSRADHRLPRRPGARPARAARARGRGTGGRFYSTPTPPTCRSLSPATSRGIAPGPGRGRVAVTRRLGSPLVAPSRSPAPPLAQHGHRLGPSADDLLGRGPPPRPGPGPLAVPAGRVGAWTPGSAGHRRAWARERVLWRDATQGALGRRLPALTPTFDAGTESGQVDPVASTGAQIDLAARGHAALGGRRRAPASLHPDRPEPLRAPVPAWPPALTTTGSPRR